MTMRRLLGLAVVFGVLAAGRDANAAPIVWLLSVDVTNGPFAGGKYIGNVVYDDSGLTGIGTERTHAFQLNFDFPDFASGPSDLRRFTQHDDPFGAALEFEDGRLVGLFDFLVCVDPTDPSDDGCDSPALVHIVEALPTPDFGDFTYSNIAGNGAGRASLRRIPEPSALLLLGTGLAIRTFRRRRQGEADAGS